GYHHSAGTRRARRVCFPVVRSDWPKRSLAVLEGSRSDWIWTGLPASSYGSDRRAGKEQKHDPSPLPRRSCGSLLALPALARMRAATPQQLTEWGRRSAEVRRQKRALIAAAPTSTPSVVCTSESGAASALESE